MGRVFDVVAVGELNPDLIFAEINGFPEMGKEKTAGRMSLRLGSSTAIAASQMSRMGLKVAMASKVGDDQFGSFCCDQLTQYGVDVSSVIRTKKLQTGLTISLSYPGDRMLITYLGSICTLASEDVTEDLLSCSRHLHVSSYYLQDSLRPGLLGLFRRAKGLGLSISLDPGDDPSGQWRQGIHEVLEFVDIFFPSEGELLGISGQKEVEESAAILGQKVPVVAAKLGSKGALLYHGGKLEKISACDVKVVDTTGAGDSFDAAFIYGFLQGYPLSQCLRLANAGGALATTGLGGVAGIGSAEDVFALAGLS